MTPARPGSPGRSYFLYMQVQMRKSSQPLAISTNDQCYWGVCLSIAASFSIMDKSWGTLASVLVIGVLLFLPVLARRAWRLATRGARITSIALLAVFVTAISIAVASVAERLILINAETYPAWLATGHVALDGGNVEDSIFDDTINRVCRGARGPTMILHKARGEIVIRCDPLSFWPLTRTYVGYEK